MAESRTYLAHQNSGPVKPTKKIPGGFPGGLVVKNPPANVGDMGLRPGLERSHMLQGNKAHVP